MNKQLPVVTKHKGAEITVDEMGRFAASVEEVRFDAYTLDELKSKLDKFIAASAKKEKLSLAVVALVTDDGAMSLVSGRVVSCTLVGINRRSRDLQLEPKFNGNARYVLADTPENVQRLVALIEADKAIQNARLVVNERAITVKGHGIIDPDKYAEFASGLADKHEASAAEVQP